MSMDELRNFNLEPSVQGILPRVTESVKILDESYSWAVPALHPYPLTDKAVDRIKTGEKAKDALRPDTKHCAKTYCISNPDECLAYSAIMRGHKLGWIQLFDRDRWQTDGQVFVYIEFFLTFYDA